MDSPRPCNQIGYGNLSAAAADGENSVFVQIRTFRCKLKYMSCNLVFLNVSSVQLLKASISVGLVIFLCRKMELNIFNILWCFIDIMKVNNSTQFLERILFAVYKLIYFYRIKILLQTLQRS